VDTLLSTLRERPFRLTLMALTTLVAGAIVALVGVPIDDARGQALAECTSAQDWQTVINNTATGGTANLPACVERDTITVPRSMTVNATGGELVGSNVIPANSWTQTSANTWRSSVTYPTGLPTLGDGGGCEGPGGSACTRSEQVWVDGQKLGQILSGTPTANQFTLDSSRRIVIGQNPAGKQIEYAVRNNLLTIDATNVTVVGLVATRATVNVAEINRDGYVVRDSDFSHGGDEGVRYRNVDGRFENTSFHHNGQVGVTGGNSRTVQQGGKCYHNGFGDELSWPRPSFHSGCMKHFTSLSVTVDSIESYDNNGNGIWFDGSANNVGGHDQRNMVIKNNRVHDNYKHGIKCEITLDCDIFSNVVWRNGRNPAGEGGSGIAANGSSFATIHANIVAWNADGIRISEVKRSDKHPEQPYYDHARDMDVYNNDIFQVDSRGVTLAFENGYSGADILASHTDGQWLYNNTPMDIPHDDTYTEGYANRFWVAKADGSAQPEPTRRRFRCVNNVTTLSALNNTQCGSGLPIGNDTATPSSRYLTASEKDSILSGAGVPTTP
jgi:hypothetical protein